MTADAVATALLPIAGHPGAALESLPFLLPAVLIILGVLALRATERKRDDPGESS